LDNYKSFNSILYTVNEANFDEIALRLFHYQAKNNPVYSAYLANLNIDPLSINKVEDVPFLPISFFKTQLIQTEIWNPQTTFLSSATTGIKSSTHAVLNLTFYKDHARRCFEHFFGSVSDYHFFALLPSYLERSNSSLVVMMDYFIKKSKSPYSGFYLNEQEKLLADVKRARKSSSKRIIVWGVSFALLDLAEKLKPDLSDCLIIETGGMKGRRNEITREELHDALKLGFGVPSIYSEYGMTELFSQAYTRGGSSFSSPPWMKLFIREIADPFVLLPAGKAGGINVIDLANIHSIAYIETEDAGLQYDDGTFEVQGRLDNSDMRGCNLMLG